jgi:hypothetical protein
VAALVAAALSACSQVSALAPVGGDRLATVRFAANDVLVQNRVPALAAPICTASGAAISCTGSTTDGTDISVSSTADQQQLMTVTIGSATLYNGPIQDVIDRAARPTS